MTHEEQIETLEVENRMLRSRCDRLEGEKESISEAYRELLLKYERLESVVQK